MDTLDFDLAALKHWLDQQTGQVADIDVRPMRGGGSCDMFELRRRDGRWVIRRAPLTAVADTAHNVVREYKVISALQDSVAKVPELLAVADDKTIIGAPFYIMKFVSKAF